MYNIFYTVPKGRKIESLSAKVIDGRWNVVVILDSGEEEVVPVPYRDNQDG